MDTKRCSHCNQDKSLDQFGNDRSRPDGKFSYCKSCVHESRDTEAERARIRKQNTKRRESSEVRAKRVETERERRYKNLYGISLEEYEVLLDFQDGRCAICHRLPKTKRLAVDHDHKTGEVRGLLCFMCNHSLHERITMDWITEAAAYLDVPPAFDALGRIPIGIKGRIKKRRRRRNKDV